MSGLSAINFGLVIAYFLPGLVSLYALRYSSGFVNLLFQTVLEKDAFLGASFMIFTLSLSVGLIVSAIRTVILDGLHQNTGIPKPDFKFENLSNKEKREAFKEAIENTFRYSQFFGNMFISVLSLLIGRLVFGEISHWDNLGVLVVLLFVAGILFVASRSSLKDSYNRIAQILNQEEEKNDPPGAASGSVTFELKGEGNIKKSGE